MYLTPEQQGILDGAKGETMAKVMKTLVMYWSPYHLHIVLSDRDCVHG